MIARRARELVAAIALVALFSGLIPTSSARADEELGWILAGGEFLILGGSIATTIAVASQSGPPSAPLAVTHFTLAAANIGIGITFIGLALSIEGGGLGGAVRTIGITFGSLQLLEGLLMVVGGVLAMTADEDDPADTPAMLVPLTFRL